MKKTVFYHAGCPVCVSAESELLKLLNHNLLEIVHLGENRARIDEASKAGVQSVPALVTDSGQVLHINFGASLDELSK